MIATKIVPIATERREAAEQMGFVATEEKLIGYYDGKRYGDYYILQKI